VETDKELLETYLDRSLSDTDGWMELWADDGRLELPYFPDPELRVIAGRDAIRAQGERVKTVMRSITFFDRVVRATDEPGTYVLEYSGDGELLAGGRYQNSYIILAKVADSRVQLWREYFNPNVRKQMADIKNKD
jgi:ketosteroid isomerase-like protein